uniref:Nectin cell adhesion molecule 3 n=1 Tax=Mola mola TaxID=94237 RepID=A0A3Q4BG49_MOLML
VENIKIKIPVTRNSNKGGNTPLQLLLFGILLPPPQCSSLTELQITLTSQSCCVCVSLAAVCGTPVVAPPRVNAVLGKNMTLECRTRASPNHILVECHWVRSLSSGTDTFATYSQEYGIFISSKYAKRMHFRLLTRNDASIIVQNVSFSDAGIYTCVLNMYQQGIFKVPVAVAVLVEPKVYVTAGPSALIDGGNETTVATCSAERARPEAQVYWESNLFGTTLSDSVRAVNDIITTRQYYVWQPTRLIQSPKLTCVVGHPALQRDIRIPYQINAPEISIVGYDEEWYVGRGDIKITCIVNANPAAHFFKWSRLDDQMPEGVKMVNGTLIFVQPLQLKDSGIYRCEIANTIDLTSRDVRIVIQGKHTEIISTQPLLKNIRMEMRGEKNTVSELMRKVELSQNNFKKWMRSTNSTTYASFVAAREIVRPGKPFTDGEYTKESLRFQNIYSRTLKTSEIVQKIRDMPLSAKTVKDKALMCRRCALRFKSKSHINPVK